MRILFLVLVGSGLALAAARRPDPAAWGADHVGKPLPQFTSGDECLFCHRHDVGPQWRSNAHNLTVRPLDRDTPEFSALRRVFGARAEEAHFALGHGDRVRALKRASAYGKLELLDTRGKWDARKFGAACAGCHTNGVDSMAQTFATIAIECYTCHGVVPAKHATERGTALLGRARKDDARVVSAICGSCHLRGGKSKSSGLPYPNNFVAGDNLFRDFRFDWSEAGLKQLSPPDAHIVENIRDIVASAQPSVTCLSCHDVHDASSQRHRRVPRTKLCRACHPASSFQVAYPTAKPPNATCGY